MSDGKRPVYEPPTLGGELERHGMAYDFEGEDGGTSFRGQNNKRQKHDKKRNKNNRRDHNHRPHKEVTMENLQSQTGGKNIENEEGNGPKRDGRGDSLREFIAVFERGQEKTLNGIRETMNDGNRQIAGTLGDKLGEINKALTAYNEKTDQMINVVEGARSAAIETETAVRKLPKEVAKELGSFRNLDNWKRATIDAVTHIGVAALVGGIIAGVGYLMSDSAVPTPELGTGTNPTPNAPTMNGSNATASRRAAS